MSVHYFGMIGPYLAPATNTSVNGWSAMTEDKPDLPTEGKKVQPIDDDEPAVATPTPDDIPEKDE